MDDNIYLDDSNVYIEGQRVSAVSKGMAKTLQEASLKQILDKSYKLDFGNLVKIISGFKPSIGKMIFYGSKPPPTDSVWKAAESAGFTTKIFDRSASGKEKMVDTQMAVDIMEDILTTLKPETDRVIIVAGDRDYVPVVIKAKERGFTVRVAYWSHASGLLRKTASDFQVLDGHIRDLTYTR